VSSSIVSSYLRGARPGRSAVVLAVLVAIGLASAGCGGHGSSPAGVVTAQVTVPATTSSAAAPKPSESATPAHGKATPSAQAKSHWGKKVAAPTAIRVADVNLVARSLVPRIKIYPSATASASKQTLSSPLPSGGPLVFLVQDRRSDRLRVLLPVRPNESQGWVRVADVKLSQLDYRITVSSRAHQLKLYRAGKLVMTEPVGLGKGATPTPGGVFYLKELLKPTDPKGAYGPYAYGLSGYSNVLHEFLGGDGEIGIHGTNEPASVGKSVSHGCIRMRNAAITKLAGMLPLGVPVQMVA
jgi:lipoprotein-anchoring transpeptidase ErfK/SrfK